MRTDRVTVTLPREQAQKLRELVATRQADSISSYVADAVGRKLARDAALRRLEQRFGQPPAEALAWARRTLGVDAEAPA